MRSVLLIVSLTFNVLVTVAGAYEIARRGGLPFLRSLISRPVPLPIKQEIQDTYPIVGEQIVLMGDSILALAEAAESFGPNFVNRAIAGYGTEDVLRRLPPILQRRPKAVVISVGINDLMRGEPAEAVIERLVRIKAAVEPNSRLIVLPLLPVNERKFRAHIQTAAPALQIPSRADIARINRAVGAIRLPEMDDGELGDAYTLDGLHLNGAGLKLLSEAVRSELSR